MFISYDFHEQFSVNPQLLCVVNTSLSGTSVSYGKTSIKHSKNNASVKLIQLYWQDKIRKNSKSYLSVRLFSEIEQKWVLFHCRLLIDLLSFWDLCWRSRIEGLAVYSNTCKMVITAPSGTVSAWIFKSRIAKISDGQKKVVNLSPFPPIRCSNVFSSHSYKFPGSFRFLWLDRRILCFVFGWTSH